MKISNTIIVGVFRNLPTSKMKRFAELVNGKRPLIAFANPFILDV